MEKIIEYITKNKIKCYFISPHLDDAIFSCGGLIHTLRKNKVATTVINVFSEKGDLRDTFSAKAFVKQCGYIDSSKLYADRLKEDRKVLDSLGVKVINLGFIDALWRKRNDKGIRRMVGKIFPEFACLYPTYKWHITKGKINKNDDKLIKRLIKLLIKNLDSGSILFFPVGIGDHVDHLIVRDAVKLLNDIKKYCWVDFPYSLISVDSHIRHINVKDKKCLFYPDWSIKDHLLRGYRSQYKAVFKNGLIKIPEAYIACTNQS